MLKRIGEQLGRLAKFLVQLRLGGDRVEQDPD
jgi:hypothetical protein